MSRYYHTINKANRTLQHIHFPGTSTFQHGLDIQSALMEQNLIYKQLDSQIRRLQKQNPTISNFPQKWLTQLQRVQPRPTVLTFQFENVYASGLKSKKQISQQDIENFTRFGCKFYQLERGGQVTWHGKGQLVAYVVIDLKSFVKLSAKCFVNKVLLQSVVNILEMFGVQGRISDENPGVWVFNSDGEEEEKITSVGVRVRHGVTEFGIALNIDPNLSFLNTFEMCGLKSKQATSLKEELEKRGYSDELPSIDQAADLFSIEVAKALEMERVDKLIL
ncbi:hypothetical protein CANMA_003704 [Candida margitis]|uniref:uncharacterized protein n=1 Tax=Candida margitis TaxID=1775924 RepID=UPI002228025B|nr:uncharacterized protein CANMA_003704 [Candida margitis]KAI5961727.1 hypothetical protein CANMA_003704 [Candida margitis]